MPDDEPVDIELPGVTPATDTLSLELSRFPLPPEDPRLLLEAELLRLGTTSVPRVLMAGVGEERLVVSGLPEGEGVLARIQAALLELPEVEWAGGYGPRLVRRGPATELLLAGWWRSRSGEAWIKVWPTLLAETAPRADLAETWDGTLDQLPSWGRTLLGEGASTDGIGFTHRPTTMEDWPGDPRLPPADATLPLEDDVVMEVALATAAAFLEDRFARTARPEPLLFAWEPSGLSFFWSVGALGAEALRVLGQAMGRDGRTRGLGLFGLGEDHDSAPPVPMVALVFEARTGETFMWRRRFTKAPGSNLPRWLDPSPQVRGGVAPLGFFPSPGVSPAEDDG